MQLIFTEPFEYHPDYGEPLKTIARGTPCTVVKTHTGQGCYEVAVEGHGRVYVQFNKLKPIPAEPITQAA